MKKNRLLTLGAVLAFALFFTACSNPAGNGAEDNNDPDVTYFSISDDEEWIDALAVIRAGGNDMNYVINITDNFSVQASTANTFGTATGISVTIRGNSTLSLDRTSEFGNLLRVGSGQTVVLHNTGLTGISTFVNVSLVNVTGSGASFIMQGNASVSGNNAHFGGGVYVTGSGASFTMRGNSSVSGTNSRFGGGVYVSSGASFTMQDNASVFNNSATNGGGVYASGAIIMQDRAQVHGNNAADNGGGLYITGTLTMLGNASVARNVAHFGGGVFNRGTVTMQGNTSIYGNNAVDGGGASTVGAFTMQDSASINNNDATSHFSSTYGGGVFIGRNAVFTMRGNTTVYGNTANQGGGGVSINDGVFRIAGGLVYGSEASARYRNRARVGEALFLSSGLAGFGTFDAGGSWIGGGNISTRDDTIRVVNGELQ